MLLSAVGYTVAALPEPTLSVQAALALRDLCDANRKLLAPQINAFAELHAGLARVPVSEGVIIQHRITDSSLCE